MKICILSLEEEEKGAWPYNPVIDPTPHLHTYQSEIHTIKKETQYAQLRDLAQQSFDVFLNLTHGFVDEHFPGLEIVQTLEHLHVPFTWADSSFMTVSREVAKMRCISLGIKTPASLFVETPSDADLAVGSLRFPLIVKPPEGHDSLGLTKASRIETREQLQIQVRHVLDAYGRANIEEFIEGREWTVLVAENPDYAPHPLVYAPLDLSFPEGETFQHFDLKWKVGGMNRLPCTDPDLIREVQENAKALFFGLDGTGYARLDFRINAAGEAFVLDINPNCDIFYAQESECSADTILNSDSAGHAGFIETIIASALARHRRTQRASSLIIDS